jgi:hypothetical protein
MELEPRKCLKYKINRNIKKVYEVTTQLNNQHPTTEVNTAISSSIVNSFPFNQYRKDTVLATLTDIETVNGESYLVFCDGKGIIACDNNDDDAVAVYPSATSTFRKIGNRVMDSSTVCEEWNHN